jgi:hypothetical protein
LAMGASVSALHWVCAQDLLQVTPFFHHNTWNISNIMTHKCLHNGKDTTMGVSLLLCLSWQNHKRFIFFVYCLHRCISVHYKCQCPVAWESLTDNRKFSFRLLSVWSWLEPTIWLFIWFTVELTMHVNPHPTIQHVNWACLSNICWY